MENISESILLSLLENSTQSYSWTSESILRVLDIGFRNQITQESPRIQQPPEIKISLRDHQKALVAGMYEKERKSMQGISIGNTVTYLNYGILGDEVGTGKSLAVLSYIAYMKTRQEFMQTQNKLLASSRNHIFTVLKKEFPVGKKSSLIIVPHNIYRQWQDYCKKQTSLNIFFAKSAKDIAILSPSALIDLTRKEEKDLLVNKIRESDAVLVSNTLYGELQTYAEVNSIEWNRIFIDEVDSIYIPSTNKQPDAPFVWFISASWSNFLLNGHCIRPVLQNYFNANSSIYMPQVGEWLKDELGSDMISNSYNAYARTVWLRIRSSRWLENFNSNHGLRGVSLLTCSKDFLKESRQMPQIIENTILCEQPISHRILNGIVSTSVQNMLHAGNIEGALTELGVNSDTPMNIVDAVTKEREKELDRLRKTLAFKETMEYATPQAKLQALESLQAKIISVEQQIKSFKDRLEAVQIEECPICYDDPKQTSAMLTPCCHRIFCASCILQSLSRVCTCPMCRGNIKPNELVKLVKEKKEKKLKKEESKLISKPKQLLKFLKENPEARVLVFSRYDNPFITLERECEEQGISYHTLRGNKDVIAATIKSFEKGEKRVLFLPTQSMGAGLNLVSATHVILLHAMTPEEEKQAIGRAYRLGREEPLNIVRLLHQDEKILPV
jgi:SNF2 family DNA or RNA helicase